MHWFLVFGVLCSSIVITFATPISRADDGSSTSSVGLEKEQMDDSKKSSNQLQQIPLQTFIKKLEDNIFEVAEGVNHLAFDKDATLSQKTLLTDDNEPTAMTKRETGSNSSESINGHSSLVNGSLILPEAILLQTTEKLPSKDGAPPHLLIDRISLETLRDGIPLIPPFEIKHTKIITASIKDRDTESPSQTLRLTKTSLISTSVSDRSDTESEDTEAITSNATQTRSSETSTSPQMTEILPIEILADGFHAVDSSPAKSTTVETTIVKAPIVKLKEAQEELQEKVAEIEAEPVILSARI